MDLVLQPGEAQGIVSWLTQSVEPNSPKSVAKVPIIDSSSCRWRIVFTPRMWSPVGQARIKRPLELGKPCNGKASDVTETIIIEKLLHY